MEIRQVKEDDAEELTLLLNEIIARGGTTALEEPFTASHLAATMLTGTNVICCFVGVERATGRLAGFQSLQRYHDLSDGIGDIATFTRIGLIQRGLGSALFTATCAAARHRRIKAINATIRADNIGGMAFYGRMGFVDYDMQRALPLKDGTLVDRIGKRYVLRSTD